MSDNEEPNSRDLFGSDDSDSDVDTRTRSNHVGNPAERPGTPGSDSSPRRPETPSADFVENDNDEPSSPKSDTEPTKRTAVISDDEGSDAGEQRHLGIDEDDEEQTKQEPAAELEDEERQAAPAEPEAEPEDEEETRIEVDIAKLDPNFDGQFVYWKVPDFVRVEQKPFEADGDDEFEDYDEEPPLDIQDAIRLKVKNTMRWRFGATADGSRGPPESNTKLVRWSDGSMSLVIGNEYFDFTLVPLRGEYHQLFVRQGTGLQGGVVFHEKVTLRPAVAANIGRKARLAARASIGGRIKEEQARQRAVFLNNVQDKDPEKMRAELMRKEEQNLKASIRRETHARRIRERAFNPRTISSGYLEGHEEDDDNSISLSAIKNQFKRGDFTRPVSYSDEEESDSEIRRKKLESAKDLDDDDDDDFGVKKKKTEEGSSKKRVVVIEDDEDE